MTLQLAIETAFAEGVKCGLARVKKDEARARSHREWFDRFLALQAETDRKQIRDAFDTGYRAAATPKVEYFR